MISLLNFMPVNVNMQLTDLVNFDFLLKIVLTLQVTIKLLK